MVHIYSQQLSIVQSITYDWRIRFSTVRETYQQQSAMFCLLLLQESDDFVNMKEKIDIDL